MTGASIGDMLPGTWRPTCAVHPDPRHPCCHGMHVASALLASTVQHLCMAAVQDSRNFAGYEQAVGEFKKGGTQVARKVGKSGKQTQQKVGYAQAPV